MIKKHKDVHCLCCSQGSLTGPQETPRGSQKTQTCPQEAPKRPPRGAQELPRDISGTQGSQDTPKMPPGSLQETPKRPSRCPQEAPKRLLRGAKGLAGSRVRVQGQGPGSRIQAPYRYSEVSGVKIRRPIGSGR